MNLPGKVNYLGWQITLFGCLAQALLRLACVTRAPLLAVYAYRVNLWLLHRLVCTAVWATEHLESPKKSEAPEGAPL